MCIGGGWIKCADSYLITCHKLIPQHTRAQSRAQVMGLLGCGRKRQLLLWAAVDLSHAVDRSDTLALRIATRALEPPDDPEAQVGGCEMCERVRVSRPVLLLGYVPVEMSISV